MSWREEGEIQSLRIGKDTWLMCCLPSRVLWARSTMVFLKSSITHIWEGLDIQDQVSPSGVVILGVSIQIWHVSRLKGLVVAGGSPMAGPEGNLWVDGSQKGLEKFEGEKYLFSRCPLISSLPHNCHASLEVVPIAGSFVCILWFLLYLWLEILAFGNRVRRGMVVLGGVHDVTFYSSLVNLK